MKGMRLTSARRILTGLGRVGRTPQEAICDIVDNAVSAGAKNVYIKIAKLDESLNDNRINNVKEYLIIDDGSGMATEQVGNALDLGSDESQYAEGTLSKFGLGLKSASFANGDRLGIVSGVGGDFHKERVDLQEIGDEYFSTVEELGEEDNALVRGCLPQGNGTIVPVPKTRNVEHPNIRSIIDGLKKLLGVIYYHFIRDHGLRTHLLNVSEDSTNVIQAFDPPLRRRDTRRREARRERLGRQVRKVAHDAEGDRAWIREGPESKGHTAVLLVKHNTTCIPFVGVRQKKSRAVRFELMSEVDAVTYLTKNNNYDWDGRTVSWLMMPKEIVPGSVRGQRVKATAVMTAAAPPALNGWERALRRSCR